MTTHKSVTEADIARLLETAVDVGHDGSTDQREIERWWAALPEPEPTAREDGDDLRELSRAASPGPWSLGRSSDDGETWHPQVWPAIGAPIASADGRPSGRSGAPQKDAADFAFIVAAVNHVRDSLASSSRPAAPELRAALNLLYRWRKASLDVSSLGELTDETTDLLDRVDAANDDAVRALASRLASSSATDTAPTLDVEREGAVEHVKRFGFDPQDFIPGYRVRFVELDNACAILRDEGWAGGVPFDAAVRALAPRAAKPHENVYDMDWPADVREWIDAAQQAIDREGLVDWDDSLRVAEAAAVRLWNYLSEGLIPTPVR